MLAQGLTKVSRAPLLYNRFGKLSYLFVFALLLSLCGCTSEEDKFRRDMQQRYEVTCDHYFSIYASSDRDGAKRALDKMVDFSLSERAKAKHYWRFNLVVAYARARLAVLAESEGNQEEARRLFASASEYMVLQNRAINQEFRRTHVISPQYSDDEARYTPDRWRKNVAALDQNASVKWREPNPQFEANGKQTSGPDTNRTPTEASSRHSP